MKNNTSIKVSSNLTFFFKFILPTFFILIFFGFIVGSVFFFPTKHNTFYIAFSFFLLVIAILGVKLFSLKEVSYNTEVCINNYSNKKYVDFKDIIKVKRFLLYFYKLEYNSASEKKSILFIPNVFDIYMNFFNPQSIIKFKEELKRK